MDIESCTVCDPRSQYSDCICHPSFKNFQKTYENLKGDDFKNVVFNIIKKWDISTMTVCCSFNSVIKTEEYIKQYNNENGKKQFYNCANVYITVKYQNKQKISAKIFSNGNIQLAGVLNPMAATYAIRKLFKRINALEAFETQPKISNVRVCMINSDFKIDKYIKQSSFCKLLDEKRLDNVKNYSFNPNKYPGINIKIINEEKLMSCIIFRPGSVIITGGNDINSYEKIYKSIIDILIRHPEVLSTPQ